MFFTVRQLAQASGRKEATIRQHIRLGWLKASTIAGVHGKRIAERDAQRWMRLHFPHRQLEVAA
ncbi:hypothetical protein UFOVP1329_43 [uncultured Caudovirales phage]|uniref:Helix-turn-helix domain-containing protein n=1 Tax=uncultured Caudovirales phage TaxID=2100421 RepID=A0A6J5S265_9CAUD|nr:hypothetical protein UFOVP1150_24 [uncultured Caudovirales phage]CAB4199395.1 hypothetical protein UFOVP1329_43 [uncultured Caudovirales phage]CAB4218770.1 hypothetical protein UFOVP1595_37 [uncultured Caudovirales phage]